MKFNTQKEERIIIIYIYIYVILYIYNYMRIITSIILHVCLSIQRVQ